VVGRDGEAIDEDIVGLWIGSHQELSLGAAAGDHLGATREDFTRPGHIGVSGAALNCCAEINLGAGGKEFVLTLQKSRANVSEPTKLFHMSLQSGSP